MAKYLLLATVRTQPQLHMQVVAANGLSQRVSVVQKDIALLERGREVRYLGCNLAIADLFDAGLSHTPSPPIYTSRAT